MIYGEINSEKIASDNATARQIVSEINNFGVTDRQRWLIIYQLALELENIDDVKSLTSYIKQAKGSDIFVTKIYGVDELPEEVNQDG